MIYESFHNEISVLFWGEMKRLFTGMHIGSVEITCTSIQCIFSCAINRCIIASGMGVGWGGAGRCGNLRKLMALLSDGGAKCRRQYLASSI